MGLKKYHAVLISSKDFWIFDPDSYDSTTKLYGDFTVIKGSSKKEDSEMKQCSYFFEIGNQDNHGFNPIAIKYDEAEGFLIVEGEQQPMGKNKKRVFQIGEEARRYKNMRGPRHSVDTIVVSRDSKKQEIKEYLKQQQDDSKSAETFQADTLNQINPIFVEGAEDVMGAESEIFCADCGGRRKYDAESLSEDAYNKDGSFKFPKPYVDCEGCGLQEDGNCDCYLDEEMIKDAKKGICPSCEYDNFNINKPCEECEVVINRDGPKYRMDAESFEAEHSCGCGDEMALEAETLYWSHKRDKECSYCGYGKNHKAALLSDDGKLFSCYKCNSYPNEEEMVALYDAEDDEISCSCESPRIRHAGVHPITCKACDLVVDAEDVVELVQEVSPFPMGKLFASFIVVGVSAIAGAKLLNR